MTAARSGVSLITTILLAAVLVLSGCGRSGDITSPDPLDIDAPSAQSQYGDSHVLWGFWEIEIDPVTLQANISPNRSAMFNANVLLFMQPPSSPTHMLSIAIDIGDSQIENNLLAIDVTLRHPFPGFNQYRGFDVRGIFMSGASQRAGFDDSAKYANWFDAAPGAPTTEGVLLNADGYTRWWNPAEFTSYGTIFGYIDGGLAPPGYHATATVNPFKYFADSLASEDPFDIDPVTRGTYGVNPGVNTRRYLIQFEGTPLRYNYAIDASWVEPDPSYAPEYPVEAWPPEGNTREAYKIVLTDSGSTAWYEKSDSNGGYFQLDIEVFDWQAVDSSSVEDEISAIWLDSPAFDDGMGNNYLDILAGSYDVLPGSNYTSAIFRAQIEPSFDPDGIDSSGDYPVFIAVESADPDTYEPQIDGGGNFRYPDAPLAAYNTGIVNVSGESQLVPTLILEDYITFVSGNDGFDAYDPAITVEGDGDVVAVFEEWTDSGTSGHHQTYASSMRSGDDGDTWPDYNWSWRTDSSFHMPGDAVKIWPSLNDISYRSGNIMNATGTGFLTGNMASTFRDGPYDHEAANSVNTSLDHASEIIQDSDGYVYILGDAGGRITFKRSEVPWCLNCGPHTFSWSALPTYDLVNPGRLSKVRSSAIYDDTMYFVYFEPSGDVIRLAHATTDWQVWDVSTIVWDSSGSGASSPHDPGLLIDDNGFCVTFVRTDDSSGDDELCFTSSDDGATFSEPVVIHSSAHAIYDSPICRYDWDGTPVLATVWWEDDALDVDDDIYASFSLDDGATWADPIIISDPEDNNKQTDLQIAPSGNWHFVYAVENSSSNLYEIHYRRAHMELQ